MSTMSKLITAALVCAMFLVITKGLRFRSKVVVAAVGYVLYFIVFHMLGPTARFLVCAGGCVVCAIAAAIRIFFNLLDSENRSPYGYDRTPIRVAWALVLACILLGRITLFLMANGW